MNPLCSRKVKKKRDQRFKTADARLTDDLLFKSLFIQVFCDPELYDFAD